MATLYTQQSKNITKTWILIFLFVLMFGFNAEISFAQNIKDENSIKEENILLGFFKNMFSFSSKNLSATASKSLIEADSVSTDTKIEEVKINTIEQENIKIETQVIETKLNTVNSSVNTQKSILDSAFLRTIVPEKVANTTKLDKKVQDRNDFLIKLAEKNPKEAISYIEKHKLVDLQQGTIAPIRKISKTNITITINHFDYEEQDKVDYFATYFDGRNTFTILSPDFKGLGGEYKIASLTGYAVGDRIIATTISGLQPVAQSGSFESRSTESSDYKILVLLVNYLDSDPAQQLTDAETTHDVLFNGDLHDFFYEQSYGKMNMVGDVYGWYTLQSNAEGTSCNPMRVANNANAGIFDNEELMNYIVTDDIQVASYDHILLIANCKNVIGGGFADRFSYTNYNSYFPGWQDIGFTYFGQSIPLAVVKTSSGMANLHTISHELGHTLYGGLPGWQYYTHANAYDCGGQIIAPSGCVNIEYGNYFDAMGSWQALSHHFRAGMKETLGWFDSDQILTVTESSEEEDFYTLTPLERIGGFNTGLGDHKMIKLQPPYMNYAPYIIEYRQGIGYDSTLTGELGNNTDGIFIYKKFGDSVTATQGAILLDMNPQNTQWEEDVKHVTLNVGQTFTDEQLGITIEMFNTNPQHAFLKVLYTGNTVCQHYSSTLNFFSQPILNPITPQTGEETRYMFGYKITNNDSIACDPSTFRSIVSVGAPLTISMIDPSDIILSPATSSEWRSVYIGVPIDTPPGTYTPAIIVTNIDSGQSTIQSMTVTVN